MKGQRLKGIDAALFRAEHATNPLTITGVMVFSAPMDVERLAHTIETRLLCIERFRQRAAEDPKKPGRFDWQEDAEVDLAYHLQRAALPEPGDQAALQVLASELASTQLDFSHPPWQLHLVEHYGTGSALVCRLHHCLADGVTLVRVLLSLTDFGPGDAVAAVEPPPPAGCETGAPVAGVSGAPGGFRLHSGLRSARRLVRRGVPLLLHPLGTATRVRSRAAELLAKSTGAAAALGVLLLYEPDPPTPFRGVLTGRKCVAWSAPVPLADVKLIGRRLGGTVNDVLIAALTGALRRYLFDCGVDLGDKSLRAVVPVNMRSGEAGLDMGNDIALVFLPLPVRQTDPLLGLAEVKHGMDAIKGSFEPLVTRGIFQLLGVVPSTLHRALFGFFGSRGTALVTNVAGPPVPLYLAGAPLDSLMFWVPQSGGIALGISILSYAGQVRMGVLVDQHLVPDPQVIVAGFEAELARLLAAASGRPEPPTVKGMLANLDRMLETIDSLR
jgi:WS/DGAT/MGAT family acyltransferase